MKKSRKFSDFKADDPESTVLVLDDWKECEETDEECIPPVQDERYDLNQLNILIEASPMSLAYSEVMIEDDGYKLVPFKTKLPSPTTSKAKIPAKTSSKQEIPSKRPPVSVMGQMPGARSQIGSKIPMPTPIQSRSSLPVKKQEIRDVSAPVMILHDIFRSQVEWQLFSSDLAHTVEKRVIAVDLRNHGTSPFISPNCGLAENLIDVRNLLKELKLAQSTVTMIGHKLSGWILMAYCLLYPYKVRNLIVIEACPNDNPIFSKDLAHVKTALNLLQAPRKGKPIRTVRFDIGQFLEEHISNSKLRSFIVQNLVVDKILGRPDKWEIRRTDLVNSLLSFTKFPEFLKISIFDKPTLFIASMNSRYIRNEDENEIRRRFPQAEFVYLKKATSYPHIDEYDNLLSIVSEFIKKAESDQST